MNHSHLPMLSRFRIFVVSTVTCFVVCLCSISNAADPLPSWNDGPAKKAILEFVAAVTDENGKDYVKPANRIATFDNDGALWVEQPIYTQVTFIFDRVKELAVLFTTTFWIFPREFSSLTASSY